MLCGSFQKVKQKNEDFISPQLAALGTQAYMWFSSVFETIIAFFQKQFDHLPSLSQAECNNEISSVQPEGQTNKKIQYNDMSDVT